MRTDSHATILDFPTAAARRRYVPVVRHANAVTEWPAAAWNAAEWDAPAWEDGDPAAPAAPVPTGSDTGARATGPAILVGGATVLPFRRRGTGRTANRRVFTGPGLGFGSWDSLPPPA